MNLSIYQKWKYTIVLVTYFGLTAEFVHYCKRKNAKSDVPFHVFKTSFHFLQFLILIHYEGLCRIFFLVMAILVQDRPVWTSRKVFFSTRVVLLYNLGHLQFVILHKRNLLIPRLSVIFLQKFLVIILQHVSEYSHDPLDSYENDY